MLYTEITMIEEEPLDPAHSDEPEIPLNNQSGIDLDHPDDLGLLLDARTLDPNLVSKTSSYVHEEIFPDTEGCDEDEIGLLEHEGDFALGDDDSGLDLRGDDSGIDLREPGKEESSPDEPHILKFDSSNNNRES